MTRIAARSSTMYVSARPIKRKHVPCYVKRFIGYLCFSLSLALVAGPFTGVYVVKEVTVKKSLPVYRLGAGGSGISGTQRAMEINVTKRITAPLPWFEPMRYLLVGLSLFIGIWAISGIYKRWPGIHLTPRPWIWLGDGICIIFLSLAAFCAGEHLGVEYFRMLPSFNDEKAFGWIALVYVPAAAILALFSSQQFGQSIEIGTDGITVYSQDKPVFLPWNHVTGLNPSNSYIPVERIGGVWPRKLQTKLRIETLEETVTLAEPGPKKTKEKIIAALLRNAPETLRHDIKTLKENW